MLFFGLFICLNLAHANTGRSPDSSGGRKGLRTPGVNYFLTNPGSATEDLRATLTDTQDIEFEKSTNLNWPPLPRAWLEYASTDYITSNTYIGFKLNPSVFGLKSSVASKLSFDFRYQVKTSFVVIASRGTNPYPQDAPQHIFLFDQKTMKTYLNVSEKVPMVGLCIYEVQFALDKGTSLNFELIGSGQSLNKGNIQSITNTHFSQFFQIKSSDDSSTGESVRSQFSVDHYQNKCNQIYKEKHQTQVTTDFSQQIMNFVFHNHPKSQCKPEFSEINPDGDASCMGWFSENIEGNIKKLTVPRCVLQNGGVHSCRLYAKKEGVSCPIFLNADGSYSDQPLEYNSKRVSTRNLAFPNFPCDEKLNLNCQIEREPKFIGSIPFGRAQARCQSQN